MLSFREVDEKVMVAPAQNCGRQSWQLLERFWLFEVTKFPSTHFVAELSRRAVRGLTCASG
jgi:hypothetical protein